MRRIAAMLAATGALIPVRSASAQLATSTTTAVTASASDSLTTREFAALIERMSAPSGYFDTDNLISNESSYLHPLTILDRLGVRGGGYIGVGPDQNFSYMARVRPRIAFLVDIRRDNTLHHLLLKALFSLSRNRAEYLAIWLGKPVPSDVARWTERDLDALVRWADTSRVTTASGDAAVRAVRARVVRFGVPLSAADLSTIERFHRTFIGQGLRLQFTSAGRAPRDYYPTLGELITERDLAGNRASYLVREADFQFLKSLQARNMVVPLVGDLAGPKALNAISAELRRRGDVVSVLYTSNVEDYLIRDGRFPSYADAVATLPRNARSVMIRSWFGGPGSHPASVPGYYTTQLVQSMESFVTDRAVPVVRTYRELVGRRFVER
ncbi:MAG TPA: hypothetical protein VE869_13990 [Gemmatimonas sp.]|nr:hypothetical protein [Gemmatimonas sp.]